MTSRSTLAAAGLALALVAAACGGGDDSDAAGTQTVNTRPQSTPTSGAGVNFDPPPPSAPTTKKSQPYWVPVTTVEGTGNTTSKAFTIDAGALQWRVAWHCESAPFSIVPVNAAGQEARRKVADALTCPSDGEGFAADKGGQTLKVTTNGPWKATIEQQVDTPLIEPAPATLASAKVLGTARIHDVDKDGEGTAKIYELANGTRVIRLEDFFVSINSDLELRLSELTDPTSTDEVAKAPFKVVAPLKATVGNMNYEVPKDVDVARYKSIVIWCEITRNAYAAASIER
ncbi:MAG TPA: DM13 domain-containing protein [Acidimicrobiales bacterium]|nr:DM13 domain-containing protein [Acidimicrobiales bacterium]